MLRMYNNKINLVVHPICYCFILQNIVTTDFIRELINIIKIMFRTNLNRFLQAADPYSDNQYGYLIRTVEV